MRRTSARETIFAGHLCTIVAFNDCSRLRQTGNIAYTADVWTFASSVWHYETGLQTFCSCCVRALCTESMSFTRPSFFNISKPHICRILADAGVAKKTKQRFLMRCPNAATDYCCPATAITDWCLCHTSEAMFAAFSAVISVYPRAILVDCTSWYDLHITSIFPCEASSSATTGAHR